MRIISTENLHNLSTKPRLHHRYGLRVFEFGTQYRKTEFDSRSITSPSRRIAQIRELPNRRILSASQQPQLSRSSELIIRGAGDSSINRCKFIQQLFPSYFSTVSFFFRSFPAADSPDGNRFQ